jgi:palmitoyltransferase
MDLNEVLGVAVPSLSDRCMSIKPPVSATAAPTPEEPDSALIVSHHVSLQKDILRINDLVAIARNVLTIGEAGQNLAAKMQFDASLFKLVTLCIKVSGRGFEFSGGTKEDERKWQLVVNDCGFLRTDTARFHWSSC